MLCSNLHYTIILEHTLAGTFNAITYAYGLAVFERLLVPFSDSFVVVVGEVGHFVDFGIK